MKENLFIDLLNDCPDAELSDAIADALATEEGRCDLSAQMDIILNRIESECTEGSDDLNTAARETILDDMTRKIERRKKSRRVLQAAVGVLVFIVGMATMYILSLEPQEPTTYAKVDVDKGERPALVIFQDGTRVTVNAGSKLTYPEKFTVQSRTMALQGEAYFEVAKADEWPFILDCNSCTVHVTGTKFNVKNYYADSTVTVTLDEGAVDLECRGQRYNINPGQQICYHSNGTDAPSIHDCVASGRSSLWRNNIIVFDKATLSEVASTICRTYGIDCKISNNEISDYTFTYTSPQEAMPLEDLLSDLTMISDVQFAMNGNQIVITEK